MEIPVVQQEIVYSSKGDVEESYITQEMLERLTPNHWGQYTVRYRKSKEDRKAVYEDIVSKFSVCGEVARVDGDQGLIYVRFTKKESAVAALERFGKTLRLKVPPATSFMKKAEKAGITTDLDNMIEVRIDRVPVHAQEEELQEFSPFLLKIVEVGKHENKKCTVAFVKFNGKDKDKAEQLKKKINFMEWKGQHLRAKVIYQRQAEVPASGTVSEKRVDKEPEITTAEETRDDEESRRTETKASKTRYDKESEQTKTKDSLVEVFVRNLPSTCTEEDIQEHFAEFSPFQIKMEKSSKRKLKSAFIKFTADRRSEAESFISKMNGTMFKDKKIIVEKPYSSHKSKDDRKDSEDAKENKDDNRSLSSKDHQDKSLVDGQIFTGLFDEEHEEKPVHRPWWKKPDKLLL